jgi:peptidoglycan/LPS O-acetylase OafA/YrhL
MISRLFFLDHLRAALVILVVLHHVALVYGAAAPFYYVEPPFTDPQAFTILLVFALGNQGWFMGALFLIAGYFTPGSFERKGSASYLKGRLIRLGIPLIIFYFILGPISSMGYWQMPPTLTGITAPLTWEAYPRLLGLGPLWFVALLLIFSFGYVAWRELTRNRISTSNGESPPPSYLGVGIFILVLALASYLMRIVVPMGKDVSDFPTLSYLPQYLSFFVVGIVSYRRSWFRTLPNSMGVVGFVAALLATVLLLPLALSGSWFSLEVTESADFVGNRTWQSAVYALWDSTLVVGLSLASITFFRSYLNRESRFGTFLAQQSYAVYIIHVPIIVWIAIALQGIELRPLLNVVLLAAIVVPTCFTVAYIIRKIPVVTRVL